MSGKVLASAAEIIVTAGAQIDALVEKLMESMNKMLEEQSCVVRISHDVARDKGEWMIEQWMTCFSLKENKKKKKENKHINIHLVLHDEYLKNVTGWEPSIFIMFAPGEDEFTIEGLKWVISRNNIDNKEGRLWRWIEENGDVVDSWMFAIPLVSINNEENIEDFITKPIQALLLDQNNTTNAFSTRHPSFKFKWDGDIFSMF